MIQALVVGGREDFVRTRVGVNLAKVGIEAKWHFDYEHEKQAQRGIPRGCELVVLLSDMTPGGMAKTVLNAARAGSYPVVRTNRKWSTMLTDLMNAGVINGPLPAAGEQLLHNIEALEEKGLLEMIQMPAQLPVRVRVDEQTKPKTFDELVDDLKTSATALMLAHDVTSIIIDQTGIDVKQLRTTKVAL